jgi:hypothetical protein
MKEGGLGYGHVFYPALFLPAGVHPTFPFLSILIAPSMLSIIGFLTFPLAWADARSRSCATTGASGTTGMKSARPVLINQGTECNLY